MGTNYLSCKLIPAFFKRIAIVIAFVVCFVFAVSGQTTNISGVVNTYHKVVEIIPAKACVRVTNVTAIDVNSRIMLVQMKGASVITTNTPTFGDTTSLNGAGNYEIGTVCFIIGDSVFLFHDLLNTYNTTTGNVQLVQFGEYYSADVVDTVKAQSWDSSAGTGGVIAIFCDQDLTLTKPIYADSSGYSGGAYYNNTATCGFLDLVGTGFVYDILSTTRENGAYKGEGVAKISATLNSAKGAPANGGGGGNNHNNSGGGGANLSAGGNGGGNSSNGPFGCNTTLNYGRGGKALSSWNGQKIFLGGGAGAGHANNGSVNLNYGGNGGGIIFIWANNIIGNGEMISANGGGGGASTADGAGGGGAGGTIILEVANYTGSLTVRANGGVGGLSDDGLGMRCFGGGGGGGGGVIYFSGTVPPISNSVTGGAGGLEINRNNPSCNAAVPGVAGSNGQIFSNYTFSRSTATAGYCRVLLPVEFIAFNAAVVNKRVELDWQIDNPESLKQSIVERSVVAHQWTGIMKVAGNDALRRYAAIDENPVPGRVQYRIKFIDKKNAVSYSPVRQIITGKDNEFVFYPNPARDKVIIAGNLNGLATIRLMDLSGKIILEKNNVATPAMISLPRLPAGIYILRVNQLSRKLIIH